MDNLTRAHRSWNMSRIKSRDTKPELIVRSILHRMGYRFRLHRKDLPGKPDIVLSKYNTIIFVHGCFWHRHEGCKYAYFPKSKVDFWEAKFQANIKRDAEVLDQLSEMGWNVLIIWECEVKKTDFIIDRLKSYFEKFS
ncbi:MAG: very short patch repair endonuclease [Desulfobacteraceae bacterium]